MTRLDLEGPTPSSAPVPTPVSTPSSQDWSGVVVLCAATPWDGHRLPDRHVAESLSRYAPILYVDPPVSPLTAWRRADAERAMREAPLRLVAPRIARLTPRVLPGKERAAMKPVTDGLTRLAIRRALRELGRPDVHATIVASLNPLFGCGERVRVFYAEDDYVAGAELMGLSAPRLALREDRQVGQAHLIVAASELLARKYAFVGADVIEMPNGCDPLLGAAVDLARARGTDAAPDLPRPIAGVIGCLNGRLDVALLEAVADGGTSVLLVGPRAPTFPEHRLAPLLARPNVTWVGPQPAERLSEQFAALDVGLVPYVDSAFNRASFPMKLLEYLSAGLPVVSTPLPAARWLDTELITLAATPDGFAEAVRCEAERRFDDDVVGRRRALAAAHSWDRRVDALAHELGIDGAAPGRDPSRQGPAGRHLPGRSLPGQEPAGRDPAGDLGAVGTR